MSRAADQTLTVTCGEHADRSSKNTCSDGVASHRRFDKQIRYESRKARADGRLRIKGRFAKSGEA